MSTIELKNELHKIIDNGDAVTIKSFYAIIKEYIAKSEANKMISESEKDIKAGRIHSQNEVEEIIKTWKE